jgi:hypothetical protein
VELLELGTWNSERGKGKIPSSKVQKKEGQKSAKIRKKRQNTRGW